MLRSTPWRFLVVALGCLAGCDRTPDESPRIHATNRSELEHWIFRARDPRAPELWKDFDAMLQEIRLGIVRETNATDVAMIDRTLIERVQGRTPTEVIVLGLETKLKRYLEMRDQQVEFVDRNALLATLPDDDSSKQHLEYYRVQQQKRLSGFEREIQTIQQSLLRYRPGTASVVAEPMPTRIATATLSRDEALAGIEEMIQRRRQMGTMSFGEWPLRIDEEGVTLPPELKDDLKARRDAAERNGHVVLPVRVKGKWWMFDAPVRTPDFSPAVVAHLTAQDKREIDRKWARLEAELWAREQSETKDEDAIPSPAFR